MGRESAQERERQYNRERDRQTGRQWYKTSRWQKARAAFLAEPDNQVCCMCLRAGLLNTGTLHMDGKLQEDPRRMHLVVDHIERHRGDEALFWDRNNWQALCPDHHDIVKQAEDRAAARR